MGSFRFSSGWVRRGKMQVEVEVRNRLTPMRCGKQDATSMWGGGPGVASGARTVRVILQHCTGALFGFRRAPPVHVRPGLKWSEGLTFFLFNLHVRDASMT